MQVGICVGGRDRWRKLTVGMRGKALRFKNSCCAGGRDQLCERSVYAGERDSDRRNELSVRANVVRVPGDESGVVSVVFLTRIGLAINATKAASMLRNVDNGCATISGLWVQCPSWGMICGASAVAVLGNKLCCVKGMSELGDVTNGANGVSVLGDIFGGGIAVPELVNSTIAASEPELG
jgi:hypothetical protein